LIAKGKPGVVSSAPEREIEAMESIAAIAAGMFAVLDPRRRLARMVAPEAGFDSIQLETETTLGSAALILWVRSHSRGQSGRQSAPARVGKSRRRMECRCGPATGNH